MKTKYEKVTELRAQGWGLIKACKKVRMSPGTYYKHEKKAEKGPTAITVHKIERAPTAYKKKDKVSAVFIGSTDECMDLIRKFT